MPRQPCTTHDLPDGARFCIRCGAAVAMTGRTERLEPQSLEERALSGEGVMSITREEYQQLLKDARTKVVIYEGAETQLSVMYFLGRRLRIED